MKSLLISSFLEIFGILTINSCSTIPEGVNAVKPFNISKYLGKS